VDTAILRVIKAVMLLGEKGDIVNTEGT
jgi:hypothetical protein